MKTHLVLVTMLSASFGQFQDLSNYDQYDDSVHLAKKNDFLTKIADSTSREQLTNDKSQWQACTLSNTDSAYLDAIEQSIVVLENQWNESKYLNDSNNVTVVDRIKAIKFYREHKQIQKTEALKHADILRGKIGLELDGTQFLLEHQCGKDRMKAMEHIKTVKENLSLIENFIYILNKEDQPQRLDNRHRGWGK